MDIDLNKCDSFLSEWLPSDSGLVLKKRTLSSRLFAQSIRVLLQNWRQGTAACKSRGQLAFSNKKPWRQKGTGRARVSSLRSPLWRKGGVIFGPQPRVRKLSMNQNQRENVLNNVFYEKYEDKKIYSLDLVADDFFKKPKTKFLVDALKIAKLEKKKVLLFLAFGDQAFFLASRNLENVTVLFFDQPNVFDFSRADCFVFLKKDLLLFNEMIKKWN